MRGISFLLGAFFSVNAISYAQVNGLPQSGPEFVSISQRGAPISRGSQSYIVVKETVFLSIGDVSITEGNSSTQNVVFPITLSAAPSAPVSVNYETINNASARPVSDFDATAISDSDGGTPGTLTIAAGQTNGSITVPIIGDTINEASEVFYILLSSPVNAVFAKARGTGTITDNDAPSKLAINDVTINEGNSGTRNATFTVSLNRPSGQVVSVDISTGGGSAIEGRDYQFLSETLRFSPGQTQQSVTIAINGDLFDEVDEIFYINLITVQNATIDDSKGKCTIIDDDRAPSLTIDDTSVEEGNSGTKQITFTINLSAISGQTVTVDCTTADGIARSSSDYQARTGAFTFTPGQTTKTFTVIVNGDTIVEDYETFYALLSNAQNASIGRGRAVGTIINDDASN